MSTGMELMAVLLSSCGQVTVKSSLDQVVTER